MRTARSLPYRGSLFGGSLSGGVSVRGGGLPHCGQIDACENTTLLQTSFAGGKKLQMTTKNVPIKPTICEHPPFKILILQGLKPTINTGRKLSQYVMLLLLDVVYKLKVSLCEGKCVAGSLQWLIKILLMKAIIAYLPRR